MQDLLLLSQYCNKDYKRIFSKLKFSYSKLKDCINKVTKCFKKIKRKTKKKRERTKKFFINHFFDKRKDILKSTEKTCHQKFGEISEKRGFSAEQRTKQNNFSAKMMQRLSLKEIQVSLNIKKERYEPAAPPE